MSVWFTSDQHFGHANIIKYANRPFKNVDEMDQAMMDNYRKVVRPEDDVYMLGDCSFYKDQGRAVALFASLPGRKYLVLGNHDKHLKRNKEFLSLFADVDKLMEVELEDPDAESGYRTVVLCHYAMRTWNKSHFGSFHLFGHSHGSLPDDPHSLSLDVGVDCWGFSPVHFNQVRHRMKSKVFKPVDKHDRRR